MKLKQQLPEILFKENKDNIYGFELIDLKELLNSRKDELQYSPYQPHRINFNAILIIESDSVIHKVDFQSQKLSKGDCLVISKGQVHAFNKESIYGGYLIIFTESFLLKYISNSVLNKILRLYDFDLNIAKYHNKDENIRFIQDLKRELLSTNEFAKEDIIASILSRYLLKLEQKNQSSNTQYKIKASYEIFIQFKKLLVAKYSETRNAQDYAKILACTYKHLNDICKTYTHKTAKAYIDDYIVLEIKRLLSSTNLSIKEVCYKCGFDEPTNFRKYFTKYTGISPTVFKNKY